MTDDQMQSALKTLTKTTNAQQDQPEEGTTPVDTVPERMVEEADFSNSSSPSQHHWKSAQDTQDTVKEEETEDLPVQGTVITSGHSYPFPANCLEQDTQRIIKKELKDDCATPSTYRQKPMTKERLKELIGDDRRGTREKVAQLDDTTDTESTSMIMVEETNSQAEETPPDPWRTKRHTQSLPWTRTHRSDGQDAYSEVTTDAEGGGDKATICDTEDEMGQKEYKIERSSQYQDGKEITQSIMKYS